MKRQIQEADVSRKNSQALTDLELEAKDRAQHLVERASALRMEQEEEIRQLNQVGCKFRWHKKVFFHAYEYVLTSCVFMIL